MRAVSVTGAKGPYLHVYYATSTLGEAPADALDRLAAGQQETPEGTVGWHFWGKSTAILAIGCSLASAEGASGWEPIVYRWIGRMLTAANLNSTASIMAMPPAKPYAFIDRGETLIPHECKIKTFSRVHAPIEVAALHGFMNGPGLDAAPDLILKLMAEANCALIPLHYRNLALMRAIEQLQKTEKTQKWMDAYNAPFAATGLSTRSFRKAYPELRTRVAHGYNGSGKIDTAWDFSDDSASFRLHVFLHRLVEVEARRRGVITMVFSDSG